MDQKWAMVRPKKAFTDLHPPVRRPYTLKYHGKNWSEERLIMIKKQGEKEAAKPMTISTSGEEGELPSESPNELKQFLNQTYPPPSSRPPSAGLSLGSSLTLGAPQQDGLPNIQGGLGLSRKAKPKPPHYEADPPPQWVLDLYRKGAGLAFAPRAQEVATCRRCCLKSEAREAVSCFPRRGGFEKSLLYTDQKPKQTALRVYEELRHAENLKEIRRDDSLVLGSVLSSAVDERKRYFRTSGVFWWTPTHSKYVPSHKVVEAEDGTDGWIIEVNANPGLTMHFTARGPACAFRADHAVLLEKLATAKRALFG